MPHAALQCDVCRQQGLQVLDAAVQLIITKPSVAAVLPSDGAADMDHPAKRPAQGCTLPEVGSSQLSTAIHSDLTSHLWACRRGLCCVTLQATDQRARDTAMSVLGPCVPLSRSPAQNMVGCMRVAVPGWCAWHPITVTYVMAHIGTDSACCTGGEALAGQAGAGDAACQVPAGDLPAWVVCLQMPLRSLPPRRPPSQTPGS